MLNFLISKISIPNGINRRKIRDFFGEIYLSIKERMNGNQQFSFYLFNEILQLPLFCTEKIFEAISNTNNITKTQFCDLLISLFFGNENDLICLLFSILDFNRDNKINIDDTKLFFIHLHSSKLNSKSENILYEIIDNFFDNIYELDFDFFSNKCQKNCDLIILLKYIVHLNRFFSFSQIEYFQERILINRAIIINTINSPQNEFNFQNKITQKLLNYISLEILENKKNKNEVIKEEDDYDILKELDDFENDIIYIMDILDKEKIISCTSNKRNEEENQKVNYLSISTENPNEKLGVKKLNTQINENFQYKVRKLFTNTKMELKLNDKEHKRAYTFHTAQFTVKNIIKKDILLNNPNEFEFLKNDCISKVRLIIIKNVIFVFELKEGFENFSYSHLIFLNSTFLEIKINQIINRQNYHSINLISTFQNFRYSIEYYTEDLNVINYFKRVFYQENIYRDIKKEYCLTKNEIGKGKFGLCFICTKFVKDIKKSFCVKTINKFKNGINEEDYKIMMWEKSIFNFLKKFPNLNIVKSYDMFEDSQNIYFIYEYIKGCDLKSYYMKYNEKNEKIKSNTLINLSSQIIKCINFLHSYGIIHRDIKHTNILINEKNTIKIIDFGLSRVLGKNEYTINPYGSLCFKAPEIILERPYNFKVDIWSVGVTLYFLLYGNIPFNQNNSTKLKEQICNEKIKLDNNFDDIKLELFVNIIDECLRKNIDMRPSCDEIIKKYLSSIQK